ncbi:hypothetical protein FOZ63_023414, partial [Perkinsus olseni]
FMMMILMSIIYRRVEQYDKLGKGTAAAAGGGGGHAAVIIITSSEFWISLSSAASLIYLTLSLPLMLINWSLAVPTVLLVVPLVAYSHPHDPTRRQHQYYPIIIVSSLMMLITIVYLSPTQCYPLLEQLRSWYHNTLLPLLPIRARKYMPTKLIDFIITSSESSHHASIT